MNSLPNRLLNLSLNRAQRARSLCCASALALALSLGCAATAVAEIDYTEYLSEDTLLVLHAPSVPKLVERLEAHPYAEYFAREDVQDYFTQLLANAAEYGDSPLEDWKSFLSDIEADTGRSAEAWVEAMQGQVLFWLEYKPWGSVEAFDGSPLLESIGLIIELDLSREALAESIRKDLESGMDDAYTDFEVEDYAGATLFTAPLPEAEFDGPEADLVLAAQDGRLLITLDPDYAKDWIDRLEGKGRERAPLAGSQVWQDYLDTSDPEASLLAFFQFQPLMAWAKEALFAQLEGDPNVAQAVNAGMVAPLDAIWEAVGLEALKSIGYSLTLGASEDRSHTLFSYTPGDNWMTDLFQAYVPVDDPFEGVPADVTSASAFGYDVTAFWRSLERVVERISPFAYMQYTGQKQMLVESAGIDFERDIIENLGARLSLLTRAPSETSPMREFGGNPTLIGLALEDGPALLQALRNTLAAFGITDLWVERDYLGSTLLELGEDTDGALQIAITDDSLLLSAGDSEFLKEALSMAQEPEDSLADQAAVRQLLERFPAENVSYQYMHLEQYVRSFFDQLQPVLEIDPGELPPMDGVPVHTISSGESRAGALEVTAILPHDQ